MSCEKMIMKLLTAIIPKNNNILIPTNWNRNEDTLKGDLNISNKRKYINQMPRENKGADKD